MALDLVLVRGDLVIVNKPAGVPTAALRDNHTGALAGAVLAAFPEMRDVGFGPLEPGLVHRLDTFTSGLVIFARSANSFDNLRRALISGGLIKRYLAVVASTETPDKGSIDANLEPHPKSRRKVLVSPPDSRHGRPASIEFRTLQSTSRRALLEVSVGPAYRHQIRALLGFVGWPVVGDELYGAPPCSEVAPQRHALHASYIRCEGKTIEPFEVSSRLPTDMSSLLGETA
jgi:23S rRNA pseudouridine1911/1915/1917 synthase